MKRGNPGIIEGSCHGFRKPKAVYNEVAYKKIVSGMIINELKCIVLIIQVATSVVVEFSIPLMISNSTLIDLSCEIHSSWLSKNLAPEPSGEG